VLIGRHLPLLLQTAGSISADWAACQGAPQVTMAGTAGDDTVGSPLAASGDPS
jgi:hypothetical protein